VPLLAIEYTPHNEKSCTCTLIVALNFIIPGAGTIYSAFLTESRIINC